jgi:hypothetical protein
MEERVNQYIESLACADGYLFSAFSGSTLLSTSFALLTKHLLGMEPKEDSRLIQTFLSQKNDDDCFVDKKYRYHAHDIHGPEYAISQFTFFSLLALDALGYYLKELRFLDAYFGKTKIQGLFEKYFSKNFWATSNQVMFLFYFSAYAEKYKIYNDSILHEHIDTLFALLKDKQNSNGFWGSVENTPSLHHQAYATAHILMFFDYYKIEIPRVDTIIDNALTLHAHNGLVDTINGGACEDYNLVDIYLRTSRQTGYRRDEVLDVVSQMKDTIVNSQESCGGFPYRIPEKVYFWQQSRKKTIRLEKYMYSSWNEMETYTYRSDIWATFFRVLTIKVIDYIADSNRNFTSARLPGWGFICNNST